MSTSHTLTNMQSIYRDYCPSQSNKSHSSSALLLPLHRGFSAHLADSPPTTAAYAPKPRPQKLALSTSSSLEKLHILKNRIIGAISSNVANQNTVMDRKSVTKSISPLARSTKRPEDDSESSGSGETTMLMMPSDDRDGGAEGRTLTNPNSQAPVAAELTKRPPLVRQTTVDSTSSSRYKSSEYEEMDDDDKHVNMMVADSIGDMFRTLTSQIISTDGRSSDDVRKEDPDKEDFYV